VLRGHQGGTRVIIRVDFNRIRPCERPVDEKVKNRIYPDGEYAVNFLTFQDIRIYTGSHIL
jgi:hypothetical protein